MNNVASSQSDSIHRSSNVDAKSVPGVTLSGLTIGQQLDPLKVASPKDAELTTKLGDLLEALKAGELDKFTELMKKRSPPVKFVFVTTSADGIIQKITTLACSSDKKGLVVEEADEKGGGEPRALTANDFSAYSRWINDWLLGTVDGTRKSVVIDE